MSKFVVNIRHRPKLEESISDRFLSFKKVLAELPPPWGLAEGADLLLPPLGSALSSRAKLRGKIGRTLSGEVKFQFRAPSNLSDRAADDDALMVEFESSRVDWRDLVDVGVPGYLNAIGAYSGRIDRWEELPRKFDVWSKACRTTGRDFDGRDGPLQFGPITYMDLELCRRACNGLTPPEVVEMLQGRVPNVGLLAGGVFIVAARNFPEQIEIINTDRLIRERLGLPTWLE